MTDYNVKLNKVRRLRVITGSLLAGVCAFALCEHVAQPASATLAAASAAANHHAPTDYDLGVDNTRSKVIAEQTDSKPKEGAGVSIANFAFEPAEITIAPGAASPGPITTARRMGCSIMTAQKARISYCPERALAGALISPASMITTARCIPI